MALHPTSQPRKRSSNQTMAQSIPGQKKGQIRTTVMLDLALKENLECLSRKEGRTQGTIIRQALHEHIKSRGLKPDRRPKLVIAY